MVASYALHNGWLRIGRVTESSVTGLFSGVVDLSAGGTQLRKHCVEVGDPEVHHDLLIGTAEVVGIGLKGRQDCGPGFLYPGGARGDVRNS